MSLWLSLYYEVVAVLTIVDAIKDYNNYCVFLQKSLLIMMNVNFVYVFFIVKALASNQNDVSFWLIRRTSAIFHKMTVI